MKTTIENKVDSLNVRINGWFENAKTDYGVEGKVNSITAKGDTITVNVTENGKEIEVVLYYVSDYTAEQLYYIWIEKI